LYRHTYFNLIWSYEFYIPSAINCTSILYGCSSFGGRNVFHHFLPFWRIISGLKIHNLTVNFRTGLFLWIHPSTSISCYDQNELVCNIKYISTSTIHNSTFTFNNMLLKALKDAQCVLTDFAKLKSLSTSQVVKHVWPVWGFSSSHQAESPRAHIIFLSQVCRYFTYHSTNRFGSKAFELWDFFSGEISPITSVHLKNVKCLYKKDNGIVNERLKNAIYIVINYIMFVRGMSFPSTFRM